MKPSFCPLFCQANYLLPPANEVWGKGVSRILSTGGGLFRGVPALVGVPGPGGGVCSRGGCLVQGGVPGPRGAWSGEGVPALGGAWWRPPPWDGYFRGWHASYWNTFLYYSHDQKSFIFRDGSRIPHRRGHQPTGAPTYDFAKFSKNCMKLRTFWGVGLGARPP